MKQTFDTVIACAVFAIFCLAIASFSHPEAFGSEWLGTAGRESGTIGKFIAYYAMFALVGGFVLVAIAASSSVTIGVDDDPSLSESEKKMIRESREAFNA